MTEAYYIRSFLAYGNMVSLNAEHMQFSGMSDVASSYSGSRNSPNAFLTTLYESVSSGNALQDMQRSQGTLLR